MEFRPKRKKKDLVDPPTPIDAIDLQNGDSPVTPLQASQPDGVPPATALTLDETETIGTLTNDFQQHDRQAPETIDPSSLALQTLIPAAPPEVFGSADQQGWYLGIDFGTTGLSATLMHRQSRKFYPVYWIETEHSNSPEPLFRLPAMVYLGVEQLEQETSPQAKVTVGPAAIATTLASQADSGLLLQNLKPYFKVGIPHYSNQTKTWEPVIRWSEQQQIPLAWVQQALQALLQSLSPIYQPQQALSCGAMGLTPKTFRTALQTLEGVVVGYPSHWSDTYSFNIREAILQTQLVSHPEQVFFIEDAIAVVLSGLRGSQGSYWEGGTLVLNAGAATSELAVVNLPQNLEELTYSDFNLRSFSYAGNALDQDIICQVLYPLWLHHPYSLHPDSAANDLDRRNWESLGLDGLDLPLPGEPDPQARHRLQQRLFASPFGQQLLEAAKHLKLILQHQDQFTLELGGQSWTIMRRQLEAQVFLPFIQRLNRELNALLSHTGISTHAINQVICTGGTASLSAIARWLRQKLPNATIIQDTYTSDRITFPLGDTSFSAENFDIGDAAFTASATNNRATGCSRVAYGLATLPLYPQTLDLPRQQYGDYFLLLELLRAFPDQPLPVGSIMQLLERRGINTHVCHLHILALLEGHLPPGLIPADSDTVLLSELSQHNLDYHALKAAPLFYKEGNQIYRPNPEQYHRLHRYLSEIMAGSLQKLEEPFAVSFST